MEIVPEIGQKLGAIIGEKGPAPLAQESLTDAVMRFYAANQDFNYVTQGSEQPLPLEIAAQLESALDNATEALHSITNAIGSIAAVRANLLGDSTSVTTTASSRTVADVVRASTPSPLVSERALHPPTRVLFWNNKNDSYTPQIPNQALRDRAEAAIQEQYKRLERFYDFLEHAPNSNEQFGAELHEIHQYLQSEGLPDAPVVILPDEQFEQAFDILYPGEDTAGVAGYERGGVAIVRDDRQSLGRRLLGKQYITDTALHEIGHTFGHKDTLFVITREHSNEAQAHLHTGGFEKYNLTYGRSDGDFLEEGQADLIRVDALTAMGKAVTLPEKEELEFGIVYVPEHQTPELPSFGTHILEMPVRYLSGLARRGPDMAPAIQYPQAAIAAYGLELLCNEVPGLRQALKDTRIDPANQAKVIKHIDSVQPGLYAELRNLPYSGAGFYRGLRNIGQAIRQRE